MVKEIIHLLVKHAHLPNEQLVVYTNIKNLDSLLLMTYYKNRRYKTDKQISGNRSVEILTSLVFEKRAK